MTYKIVGATEVPISALHQAMLAAFADYVVPMRPSLEQFQAMLHQRSFEPTASAAVQLDGNIAAFWFVGVRGRQGYLITSGTLPEHRSRGLSKALSQRACVRLREMGCTSLQLEVITSNDPAVKLYQRLGFFEVRRLACYTLQPAAVEETGAPLAVQVDVGCTWRDLQAIASTCHDWSPSWQNDDQSIVAAGDDAVCAAVHRAGALAGYAVLSKNSAALAQLAIHPDYRRQGIGTHLVRAMQGETPSTAIRVLNAQADDQGFRSFLVSLGASHLLDQFEMRLDLSRMTRSIERASMRDYS